jgi:enamine deaminase RidA (YjgF/YER057c/UK114 family)
MQRSQINPWAWSLNLGFDQAEAFETPSRVIVCSGQDAVDPDGQPQHPGDMAAQLEMALDNVESVLSGGDMTLANLVRMNVYTTDVDELFKHWALIKDRVAGVDGHFATSVVGVTRLAAPPLLVLLEATAVD